MKSLLVKELESNVSGGKACLISLNDKFYRISYVPRAFDTGCPETLAFESDSDGNVKNWADLAGGRNMSIEETIAQLEDSGENEFGSGLATIESGLNAIINPPSKDYYK